MMRSTKSFPLACVCVANLERPNTRRVVNSGIIEAADFLAALANKGQELQVHPDVMAGHLLVLALGESFTHPRAAR